MKMLHLEDRVVGSDIERFHVSIDGFDMNVVSNAIAAMRSRLAFVRTSRHFYDRKNRRAFVVRGLKNSLLMGSASSISSTVGGYIEWLFV